jgi:hypothetical protein
VLAVEPLENGRRIGTARLGLSLGQREEVLRVPLPVVGHIGQLGKAFACELPDRLEHEEAPGRRLAQEALVDERRDQVDVGPADGLGRLELEASRKDREPRKRQLLVLAEQLVTPGDRAPQRALAYRRVACSRRQEVEAALEAPEDLAWPEHLDAGGGELQRQRETVEAAADLFDVLVGRERGGQLTGASGEEGDGGRRRERRHGVLLLDAQTEALAARRENADPWGLGEQRGDARRRGDQLLEVVEQEKCLLRPQMVGQAVPRADDLRDRGHDELRVLDGCQRDPPDAVPVLLDDLCRSLQREARLAGATCAGEGQHRGRREEREHVGQLLLAADERAGLHREVRLVQALERWEVARPQLVDPLGSDQILQAVLAEIEEIVTACELSRRLRDQDLAAVTSGRDPRGAVDVEADVAFVRQERLAGVHTDAHADQRRGERVASVRGGRKRIGRPWECDEEGVALRVHLDAAVALERLPQQPAVLREGVGVRVAELVQQARRALDVGEEEGDSATRKLPHGQMIRQNARFA